MREREREREKEREREGGGEGIQFVWVHRYGDKCSLNYTFSHMLA